MIALDTNVLVRLVVEDPDATEQSERARRLVDRAVEEGKRVLLADVVLCEFVWVLREAYRVEADEIANTIMDLLQADHIVLESPEEVARATTLYASGPADLADYLLTEVAASAGCEAVYSFDSKLLGRPGSISPEAALRRGGAAAGRGRRGR